MAPGGQRRAVRRGPARVSPGGVAPGGPGPVIAAGLQGALLLARGRPDGITRVPPGQAGAARSFWAGALCLPSLVVLRLADWVGGGWPATPAAGAHMVGLQLLGTAIGWLGFALASRPLARAMGREARWPLFLAAWNWCNVVQSVLWVAAVMPDLLGAPAPVGQVVAVVATGWALWLEWYAARLSLQVGGMAATGMVALDAVISLAASAMVVALGG